jgi:hypothetical protein
VGVKQGIYASVVACAVCLALVPSGAAGNRWRPSQTLGGPPAGAPLFAGAAGLSVAAWTNRDQSIDVSELNRLGRFGPSQQIRAPSGGSAVPAQVGLAALAVSSRGDAVLVWVHRDIPSEPPEYSVRSGLTGQWSTPAALDRHGEGMAGLTAAIDSTGTVTFAWVGSGPTKSPTGAPIVNALRTQLRRPVAGGRREVLFAQRAPGATSFRPFQALPALARAQPDAGGRTLSLRLQTGVDDTGGAMLAWLSRASGRALLLAQHVTPDGQLGPMRQISPPGAAAPRLAVNGRGDSALTWRFYPTRPARVRAAVAAAGHNFGRPVTLSGMGSARSVLTPQVALDPAGNAVVMWTDFRQSRRGREFFPKSSRLWWSLRVRGHGFTPALRLSSPRFSILDGVALAPGHRGTAVWTESTDRGGIVVGAVFR